MRSVWKPCDVCAYEVRTKVPNMNCVLVIEKDGEIRQRVPYDPENGAVIYLTIKNPALSGNLSTKTLHRLYFL